MNTTDKTLLIVLALALAIIVGAINSNTRDIARLEKYDTCLINLVEKDPNEVEIRSRLLEECMNK